MRTLARGRQVEIGRLRAARDAVAILVADDPVYAPIFVRLELELAAAMTADPVERARAIAATYRAMA